MSLGTFTSTITFHVEQCCVCFVTFAMTKEFHHERQKDRKTFYCPLGHAQHYTNETEEQQRIRHLEMDKKRLERENAVLAEDFITESLARKEVQKKLSTTKGQLTRTKNRVAAGVCPCCTRSFVNLQRHMATKHPSYSAHEPAEPQ